MSITSANSIFMLAIIPLFPIPQRIQGYAADDIFSTEPIETAETQMGVDGKLSAGFVFNPIKWSINLMADSASNAVFDFWYTSNRVVFETFSAEAILTLPSIGTSWVMSNGYLSSLPPIPDGGKTLKSRKFTITWESVLPAPVG